MNSPIVPAFQAAVRRFTFRYNGSMLTRTNEEWLADLRESGERQGQALEDLRALILRGLPYALAGKIDSADPAYAALAEEVAQETLLKVLDYLDSFQGRSAFTTWVYKIAARQALTELRRHRWRDVPLPDEQDEKDGEAPPHEMPDPRPDPGVVAERGDLLERVERVFAEELTEKQRSALTLVAVQGLPPAEAARRIGIKENALYKLLHDARARLKQRLYLEGLSSDMVLAAFSQRVRD